jgi:hypothetical protein
MAGEKQYIVKGAVAVLPIEGGSERYLYRGAQFSTGYTEAGVKHALALGLIAVVKAPTAAEKTAAEKTAAEKTAAEQAAVDKAAADKAAADSK